MARHGRTIGMTISDRTIEIVLLRANRKKATVVSYNSIELAAGVVVNGRIKNKEVLLEHMQRLFTEATPEPIEKGHLAVALPDVLVFTHAFELSPVRPKQLDEVLARAITQVVPLPADDIVFAEHRIEKKKDKLLIMTAVSSAEAMQEWKNFFSDMGYDIEDFDIEQLAQYRGINSSDKSVTCIVDIGSRTTSISFFIEKELRYTQTGHHAGEAFSAAIAGQVDDPEQAKRTDGMNQPGKKAKTAIEGVATVLAKDIQKAIEFFEHTREVTVEDIVFIGGSSRMPGLIEFLLAFLKREGRIGQSRHVESEEGIYIGAAGVAASYVERQWSPYILTIPTKIPEVKKQQRAKTSQVSDIGGAIDSIARSTDDIYAEAEQRRAKKQVVFLGVLVVLGLVAIVWAFWYQSQQRQRVLAEQEAARNQVDEQLRERGMVEDEMQESTATLSEPDMIVVEQLFGMGVVVSDGPTVIAVYEQPDSGSQQVARVSVGDRYEIVAQDIENQWWQILIPQEGDTVDAVWISKQYLRVEEEVVDNISTSTPDL